MGFNSGFKGLMSFHILGCVEGVTDPDNLKDFNVTISESESLKMSETIRF